MTSYPADPPQGLSRVIFLSHSECHLEPSVKRAIAFVDGQNLFHNVRYAFGYTYPNYDVQKLSQAVCNAQGWTAKESPVLYRRSCGRR